MLTNGVWKQEGISDCVSLPAHVTSQAAINAAFADDGELLFVGSSGPGPAAGQQVGRCLIWLRMVVTIKSCLWHNVILQHVV
jgi:hypothetical protein